MARYKFGGTADYLIAVGAGNAALLQPGGPVSCWNALTGGSKYEDLQQTDGTPIPLGNLTADGLGAVPEFLAPDTVKELYYAPSHDGTGARRKATTIDLGGLLGTLESAFNAHAAAVNPHLTKIADLADAAAEPATDDVIGGSRLTYDAGKALWRPDGSTRALMGWHAALANRFYQRANVVVLGDSIAEGQGTTAFANSWPAKLRAQLRARFPTPGVAGGRGFIGALSTGSSSFTWPASATGGPGTNDDWGPKRLTYQLDATAPADRITYSALQGTAVDIMWTRLDLGGSFQWRADGGSWTTVNTGGAQQDGMLTRATLGSSGAHALDIEANSAGFQAFVSGVVEFDGDENAGVTVHDAAHFGFDTSFWLSTYSGPDGWPSAISALNPHLIVVALGANDMFNSLNPSTFQTQLTTLISTLRGAVLAPSPFPPILLLMYGARGGTFAFPWSQYVDAAHAVAAGDALVACLDCTLGPRVPNHADNPNYALYADTAHLSNKGNSMIADLVADFISPH